MLLILWKSKNVKHLNVFWDLGHICMGSFQIPVSREHKMQITPATNNACFVSQPKQWRLFLLQSLGLHVSYMFCVIGH